MRVFGSRVVRGSARDGRVVLVLRAALLALALPGAALAQVAPASGQPSLLRRPARLEVRGVALDAALAELGRSSGVPLALSPALLAGRGPVSCRCAAATVGEALDSLLAGTGLGYVETASRVIVRPQPRAVQPAAPAAARPAPREPAGSLAIEVASEADGQRIPGAEIQVSGRIGRWLTDAAGRAGIVLTPGTYEVAARALGYSPARTPGVTLSDGESRALTLRLTPAPVALDEVVVTPGTYGLIGEQGAPSAVSMSREEVETTPHLFEDVYRAVNRLPGVTSGDFGVHFEVRGAPSDQVLVLLDGLRLHEPFHLREMDGGMFSIVDVETVADVNLQTGGFGAEHGDRLGGVFSLRTATPDRTSTTVGASLQNFTARSQGVFAGGRGTWLASARRGFLDIVLGLVGRGDAPVSPTYYDGFGKVQYQVGMGHLLSAQVLYAGDDLSVDEDDGTELSSRWSDGYAWLTWAAALGRSLSASTVLSAGRLTRHRGGTDWSDASTKTLDVADRAEYEFLGLAQDWSAEASTDWALKWGFDLRRGSSRYDYRVWRRSWVANLTDPSGPSFVAVETRDSLAPRRSGTELGVYVANRVRPVGALTAEAGLRFDYHSHAGDRNLAPRVNVAWQVSPGVTLRTAWGLYYQSHGLPDLPIADLDTVFLPAQRAEHRVVSLERRIGGGTTVRVEAYERLVRHPWPEYRSLQGVMEVLPERGPGDRARVAPARVRARGVELLARREGSGPLTWTASYVLASSQDEIDGAWVPRPHDQRHTVRAELSWRPNGRWSLTGAWQYHSPWPITDLSFGCGTTATGELYVYPVEGPLNGGRLAAYHRLDARVTRHFTVGRGRLSVYFDAFNLYNRHNALAFRWEPMGVVNGAVISRRVEDDVASLLPTIGARWEF